MQDQEYSLLRHSHIATIEEIGQYKTKLELKEKARQQIVSEKKALEIAFEEQEEYAGHLQKVVVDERAISKDLKEEMKIRGEEWSYQKACRPK